MKDRLLLLLTGILAAAAAWGFWSTTGRWGFVILQSISFAVLLSDNVRLRRAVKRLTAGK